MLHRLKLADRLTELLAVAGIANRVIQRALREADHLRADADAPFVQRLDGDLVAFADFTQHVRARDAALLEQQLAGAARADAQLVLFLADGEAGRAALDQKRRHAAVARVRVD